MNLPLHIAWRYLFSRKSHNVINIISAISAVGMAVGTAALVLILSVYNGFDGIIRDNLSDISPDIRIEPSRGKSFIPSGPAFDALRSNADVRAVSGVIEENVFLSYGDRQAVARARGVDSAYLVNTALVKHLKEGNLDLWNGDLPQCCLGSELAWTLGAYPRFQEGMTVYFPKRGERISMSDPMSSLSGVKVFPGSVVTIDTDTDKSFLLLPLDVMRDLVGYTDEVSALELRTVPGTAQAVASSLRRELGSGFRVLDIYQQNADMYRMMRYEKLAVFAILILVIIIVAFNVFSSLSMLIIEKKEDISTLRAMGADDALIRKVFVFEGWLVSLLGMLAGLAAGLALAWLQQRFGIIKMPGNYLIDSYPVIIKLSDILVTVTGVAVVGYVTALLPAISSATRLSGPHSPEKCRA